MIGGAGCDAGPTAYEPLNLLPLTVHQILAATGLDTDGSLYFEPIWLEEPPVGFTVPPVLSSTSFKVQFDRLLLPDTATRQAVCVQPVLGHVVSAADCGAGIFLSPSYDPVRREVTLRPDPTAARPQEGSGFQLTLYTAIAPTDSGVRSFDGVPLREPVTVTVTVATHPGRLPPFEPLPTGDHYCTAPDPACTGSTCARSVSDLFTFGCGASGCHSQSEAGDAPEGMRLDTAALVNATAVNQVAHETQTGESALDPDQSGQRFGRAMPIITPQVPGNSYMLYKLLAHGGVPLRYPFRRPVGLAASADAPEIVALRSSVVVGMPMPPSTNPFAVPRAGEMKWLSDWILQGAPTKTCP